MKSGRRWGFYAIYLLIVGCVVAVEIINAVRLALVGMTLGAGSIAWAIFWGIYDSRRQRAGDR
jgi:hypothetical protein